MNVQGGSTNTQEDALMAIFKGVAFNEVLKAFSMTTFACDCFYECYSSLLDILSNNYTIATNFFRCNKNNIFESFFTLRFRNKYYKKQLRFKTTKTCFSQN